MPKVTFKKKWFAPWMQLLLLDKSPYHVYWGGAGGGKSVAIAKRFIYLCMTEKYFRLVYSRKVGVTIRDSCFQLFNDLISEAGLSGYFHINKTDMSITYRGNGNKMIARGMDDPEKVKSIAEPTHVWLEEATEFSRADFDQLDLRLRSPKGAPQVVLSFNPVSRASWVHEVFFEHEVKGAMISHTTYRDNPFIDAAAYAAKLERIKQTDEALFFIYSEGKWGVEDINKFFVTKFDEERHVSKVPLEYDPELPLYLSFDFNIVSSCLAFQYGDGFLHVLKEYRMEGADLVALSKQILKDYPDAWIFVNGDASGGARSALTKGNRNAFEILRNALSQDGLPLSRKQIRVPRANPPHTASRLVCNLVLQYEPGFLIDPSCVMLIKDLKLVKWSGHSIDKSLEDQGIGHLLDAWRYHLWREHRLKVREYGLDILADKAGIKEELTEYEQVEDE